MDREIILQYIEQFYEYYQVNIQPYLFADYKGQAFELFDTFHLAALGVIGFIILLIIFSRNKLSEKNKENLRDTMAAILILNEISWHLWASFYNEWTIQKMLPLHIFSILIWLSAWMLIKKSYRIYEFAYFLGIGGALQALLTPDTGIYGFPHYRFFQTFISHGFIIIAAIYMTVVEEMRPTWKSILRVFVFTNIYMAAIYGINILIDSNYLYVNAKPPTASILDMFPDWPIYLLYMEGVGLATSLLLYLPYFIKDSVVAIRLRISGKSRLDDFTS
ncbi:MAG: TIGR02206 family membrane protein [Anaerolineae bacterium]|jgi:hypothetical integral membrane protein (TIGR02206 family)|nr:TIGR02206 family membrane protein [Anaerolineae bacterium]MBT7070657.1 TIGR02206 family membrane protein [Anaerolineae bacterium]MBT7326285.1 TIGR02206 family membrane protein [Anaerolineae bacterium]